MNEKIKTSISLNKINREKLAEIQKITGFSKDKICKKLLFFYARKLNEDVIQKKQQVSYQSRIGGYKPVTIILDADEYDFLMNIRNCTRLSISFLIAIAIEYFGEKIIKILKRSTDRLSKLKSILRRSLIRIVKISYGIYRMEKKDQLKKIYYYPFFPPKFYSPITLE